LEKSIASVRVPIEYGKALYAFIAIGVLVCVGAFALVVATADYTPPPAIRVVPWRLRGIANAQGVFKEQYSRALSHQSEGYWRKDIAGLCVLEVDGHQIRLIEVGLALADIAPVDLGGHSNRAPIRCGYWFRAIRFRGEEEGQPDSNRFAICAFPDRNLAKGTLTFIISNDRIVYGKALEPGDGVSIYPDNPSKEGWSEIK
jgi:hypothetical protein